MKSIVKLFLAAILLVAVCIVAAGCVQVAEQSPQTSEQKDSVDYFRAITEIPRPSGHEDKIRDYLIEFAKYHNLTYKTDDAGNLLITRPAAQSGATKVILQAHMDMVPTAVEGKDFDFTTQPIPVIEKDGWFTTDGTTLGADDGSGIAIIQAILASSDYPGLEISGLFTVEEETTFKGANNLKPDFMQGDILINLDHTDTDEIVISSAGSVNTEAVFTPDLQNADSSLSWYTLSMDGLSGGHSGDDVDKNRGNAIRIAAGLLSRLNGVTIASFEGGTAGNAIPSSVRVQFGVPAAIDVQAAAAEYEEEVKKTISDKYFSISAEKSEIPEKSWTAAFTKDFLSALSSVPNGVLSRDEAGQVETSSNMGIIKNKDGKVIVTFMVRSSSDTDILDVAGDIADIMKSAGAEVTQGDMKNPWKTDRNTKLVKLAEKTHENLFSEKLKVSSIHAGLEIGNISLVYPNLEIISAGVTYTDAHTPKEKMSIAELQRAELFIRALLENIQNYWK